MKSLSRVWLLVTPWTAAYQAPLSVGFSRQEYWSGVPLPSPKLFTVLFLYFGWRVQLWSLTALAFWLIIFWCWWLRASFLHLDWSCVPSQFSPYNLMDYSLTGSSVHGIFMARILEWVAVPSSRGSSQPRDPTCVSCIAGKFFTAELLVKPRMIVMVLKLVWHVKLFNCQLLLWNLFVQLIVNNFKILYLDILVDKVSSLCFLLFGLFYLGEFIYIIFSSPQSRHTLKFLKNFLFQFAVSLSLFRDSLVAQTVKSLSQGSIPGSGRSLGEGNKNSLSILAWKTPCMEEPDGLQAIKVRHDWATSLALCFCFIQTINLKYSSEVLVEIYKYYIWGTVRTLKITSSK